MVVMFNMAVPYSWGQTTSIPSPKTSEAKTKQAPAAVAPVPLPPVSPAPVTPSNASNARPSSSGSGQAPRAATNAAPGVGEQGHPNYDPLNPVTSTGEIDKRFLRWTPPQSQAKSPTGTNSAVTTNPNNAQAKTAPRPGARHASTAGTANQPPANLPVNSAASPAAASPGSYISPSVSPPASSGQQVSKPPVGIQPAAPAAKSPVQTSPPAAVTSAAKTAPVSVGTGANQTLLKPQVPKIAEPAVAPDITKGAAGVSSGSPSGTTAGTASGKPGDANAVEKYPAVAHLEVLTFGETHPAMAISDRLANLESTVFKETHPTDSLFARTERLQKVLVGSDGPPTYENPQYRPADLPSYARVPPPPQQQQPPSMEWAEDARRAQPTGNPGDAQWSYFDEIAILPENRVVVNSQQLQDYFLEMVNNERRKVGAPPLEIDQIAEKLATEHVAQLAERAQISHSNVKGENPDRRYTLLGGTDAVTESLVSLKSSELGSRRMYRGAAAKLLRVLMSHQDDRDALTSRDTTHVGFAAEWTSDRSRLIACAELVSKHAIIHPVPSQAHVDEKIDVKGVMTPPYSFVRVTLAWEGAGNNLASVADETDEALPYFPPLDYVAYQKRAESGGHDKAVMILKGVGIAAAIAGGVFMPPVALAAPLIAVAGSGSAEHKPASEIPVKGGVKLEGSVFETKVPLSNEGKDGLYYLTVWGSEGQGGKPVPISRRVIYVSSGKEDQAQTSTNNDTGEITSQQTSKKDEKSAKKAKKNKSAPPSS